VIGWLRGTLLASSDGNLVVDVGGVGYELSAPLGTAGRLTPDAQGMVVLHVHTHLREDALQLFGFASAADRAVFRAMLGVSKVGPKLALAVLGAMDAGELSRSIESGTVAALARVPGIGKRTAERMILELRGKLPSVAGTAVAEQAGAAPTSSSQDELLHATLVRMGFRPAEAERAVKAIPRRDRPLGELVREALSILAP
jgi:Holliday junction DNA helicase RuvA